MTDNVGISRRKSREIALQILYQMDLNQEMLPESAIFHFDKHFNQSKTGGIYDFTSKLVTGVAKEIKLLDEKITSVSENWRIDRMPVIDRNLLRLGTYELLHCDEIPKNVTLNEMIEIAKQFGSEQTPQFVNGLLDKIALQIHNPKKAP